MSMEQFFAGTQDNRSTPRIVIACPGNGTRYTVAITPISEGACRELGAQVGSFLIAIQPATFASACAIFAPRGWLGMSYVAEKLRVPDPDAFALTKIIAEALGRPY